MNKFWFKAHGEPKTAKMKGCKHCRDYPFAGCQLPHRYSRKVREDLKFHQMLENRFRQRNWVYRDKGW